VGDVLSPYIEIIPNAFTVEYTGKFFRCFRIFIGTASGIDMNMMTGFDFIKIPWVCKCGQVMCRTIIKYLIIPIAFGVLCEIIHTTHTDGAIDNIRAFQK